MHVCVCVSKQAAAFEAGAAPALVKLLCVRGEEVLTRAAFCMQSLVPLPSPTPGNSAAALPSGNVKPGPISDAAAIAAAVNIRFSQDELARAGAIPALVSGRHVVKGLALSGDFPLASSAPQVRTHARSPCLLAACSTVPCLFPRRPPMPFLIVACSLHRCSLTTHFFAPCTLAYLLLLHHRCGCRATPSLHPSSLPPARSCLLTRLPAQPSAKHSRPASLTPPLPSRALLLHHRCGC